MRTVMMAVAAIVMPAMAHAQAAVKTADYEFDYGYPAAAGRFPALRAWLEGQRSAVRASVARRAAADRRAAAKGGYPFRPWSSETTWKVVTETPRFLSLSGSAYAYTGGAHGNTRSIGLVWDKTAKRRLEPRDLFTGPAAIQQVLGKDYCRLLNVERERKRGEPVKAGSGVAGFNECVPVKDTTLLLGSTNRRAIDRIGLIADPYVAGSYAEGSYEVTLPVTSAVLGTVKPAYRAAFAIR